MALDSATKIIRRGKFYKGLMEHVVDFATLQQHAYHPTQSNERLEKTEKVNNFDRNCSRCGANYTVDKKGMPEKLHKFFFCTFHPGKKFFWVNNNSIEQSFTCCKKLVKDNPVGCKQHHFHISNHPHYNTKKGFISTKCSQGLNPIILSLDCEMCVTAKGSDCTRVTIVDKDKQVIYESLVQPDAAILDYVTDYSGITEEMLKVGPTKTLKEVQTDLLSIIKKDTVLIGHGIYCDLKALKLEHDLVVDTSLVFPHYNPKLRNSLRHLAWTHLRHSIQNGAEGHDSAEDAKTCMDLMIMKLNMGNHDASDPRNTG